jgi:hypothetical protein
MIAPAVENSPNKAPTHFARLYGTHTNTFIRWCRDGVLFSNGTRRRPEHIRTPGGYRATEAAVEEFLEAVKLDRQRRDDAPEAPAPRRARQTERLAQAKSALAAEGF